MTTWASFLPPIPGILLGADNVASYRWPNEPHLDRWFSNRRAGSKAYADRGQARASLPGLVALRVFLCRFCTRRKQRARTNPAGPSGLGLQIV